MIRPSQLRVCSLWNILRNGVGWRIQLTRMVRKPGRNRMPISRYLRIYYDQDSRSQNDFRVESRRINDELWSDGRR